jgi:hypothetical protein
MERPPPSSQPVPFPSQAMANTLENTIGKDGFTSSFVTTHVHTFVVATYAFEIAALGSSILVPTFALNDDSYTIPTLVINTISAATVPVSVRHA